MIARCEPQLFRQLFLCARNGYHEALKLYHITADFSKVPPLDGLEDGELPRYLELDESRQLLHISYGTILNDRELGPRFFAALHRHGEAYAQTVCEHFTHHFEALGIPSRSDDAGSGAL